MIYLLPLAGCYSLDRGRWAVLLCLMLGVLKEESTLEWVVILHSESAFNGAKAIECTLDHTLNKGEARDPSIPQSNPQL